MMGKKSLREIKEQLAVHMAQDSFDPVVWCEKELSKRKMKPGADETLLLLRDALRELLEEQRDTERPPATARAKQTGTNQELQRLKDDLRKLLEKPSAKMRRKAPVKK